MNKVLVNNLNKNIKMNNKIFIKNIKMNNKIFIINDNLKLLQNIYTLILI